MKISLILMAVLFAVVPVLGISAPSASAEEVVSYPEVINQGDTIYFNPDILVTSVVSGYISYRDPSSTPFLELRFSKYYSGAPNSYSYVTGHLIIQPSGAQQIGVPFYFYSSDSSLVGVNLSSLAYPFYPDYVFLESDLGRPIYLLDSYTYEFASIPFVSNTLSLDTSAFSLSSYVLPEDTFVDVWGETADFVGDIFIQVGELFYDDTAEELTPVGTLAVILAGIAVVLLVWNLIRSFLPMRG